ncbi:hypothetical protein ACFL4D_01520 [Candidatus Margulisiibacteriota bacterium]
MEGFKRQAVILSLVEKLIGAGNWCGETHIQKAIYFLQEIFSVHLGFEFILYKHGPYSFSLKDELANMKSYMFLESKPNYPYGPNLCPGETSDQLKHKYPRTINQYKKNIDNIAKIMGKNKVVELERLATALYVRRKNPKNDSVTSRAEILTAHKPHVSIEDAETAIKKIDEYLNKFTKTTV